MKFESPLFDGIRVKPGEDRRPQQSTTLCAWPGCSEGATHRAPKGRMREGEYWRFCLAHVREYNHSYNYFTGMSDDAVAEFQKDAITGHRPTWKMGVNGRAQTDATAAAAPGLGGARDPFGVFREFGGRAGARVEPERPEREGRMIRNVERKAFDTLGLDIGASRIEIKAKFKTLVKRHHPDANNGDRSTEDRLREIIQAYNYLKTAGFC
jgi:curved DNA-binding protein CbpA